MRLSKLQKQMIKNMKEIEERNNFQSLSLNDVPPLRTTIDEAIKIENNYLNSLDEKESEI